MLSRDLFLMGTLLPLLAAVELVDPVALMPRARTSCRTPHFKYYILRWDGPEARP